MTAQTRSEICTNFEASTVERAKSAMGQYGLVVLGLIHHAPIAAQYPDAINRIGEGPPDQSVREVKYTPTHREVADSKDHSLALVLEGALSDLVQQWHELLKDLYEVALTQTIEGHANYVIEKIQPRLTVAELRGPNAMKHILSQAVRDFDFEDSSNKLRIVRKIYNVILTDIQVEVNTLNKFVLVRNIFEHRNGIASARDIADAGGQLALDAGTINIGDRIQLSPYDIETISDSMIAIAKKLSQ